MGKRTKGNTMIYFETVKEHNYNNVFIETGTYTGLGVEYALEAKYDKIITIELDTGLFNAASAKFTEMDNVTLLHGDSSELLNSVLTEIDEPCTIWLDAHGNGTCPALLELDAIKKHKVNTHTILIDDMLDFGRPVHANIKVEELLLKLYEINKDYIITYVDCPRAKNDILVARVNRESK